MDLKSFKQSTRDLIAEGDIRGALRHLSFHVSEQASAYEEIMLIKSKFNQLEKHLQRDLIVYEEYRRNCSRVAQQTLSLLEHLNEPDLYDQVEHDYIRELERENRTLRKERRKLQAIIEETKYGSAEDDTQVLKSMTGYWLEHFTYPTKEGATFAIGEFKYNKRKYEFEYNGSSYDPQGHPQATWVSIKVFPDLREREIFYIYSVKKDLKSGRNTGFGYIEMDEWQEDQFSLEKGYFFGAGSEKNPKYFHCFSLKKVQQYLLQNGAPDIPMTKKKHGEWISFIYAYVEDHPGFLQEI